MTKRTLSAHRCELAPLAIGVLLLSVIVLAAAAKNDPPAAQQNRAVYAALAKAPNKAVNKRNPFEADADAAGAGQKLFEEHCAECHGGAADGTRRGPSLWAPKVQRAAPGAIFWILSNGVVRRGMPDWSKLPEQERWQLVMFIKSLAGPQANHEAPARRSPPMN